MITLFDNETILKGYTREKVNAALNEGLAKGRAAGRAEGERRKAIETARKMLQEAMPIDLIARISGLSVPEINAIKPKLPN